MEIIGLENFAICIIDMSIEQIKETICGDDKTRNYYHVSFNEIDIGNIYEKMMSCEEKNRRFQSLFFNPRSNPLKTIVIGGWETFYNYICKKQSSINYQFGFSPERSYFDYYDGKSKGGRTVQVILDESSKWKFYEQGTPLWFEDLNKYKKKKVTERFNIDAIIEYTSKLDIDILNNKTFQAQNGALYVSYNNMGNVSD